MFVTTPSVCRTLTDMEIFRRNIWGSTDNGYRNIQLQKHMADVILSAAETANGEVVLCAY